MIKLYRAGRPEAGDYAATGAVGLLVGAALVTATKPRCPPLVLAGSIAAALALQAVVGVPERS